MNPVWPSYRSGLENSFSAQVKAAPVDNDPILQWCSRTNIARWALEFFPVQKDYPSPTILYIFAAAQYASNFCGLIEEQVCTAHYLRWWMQVPPHCCSCLWFWLLRLGRNIVPKGSRAVCRFLLVNGTTYRYWLVDLDNRVERIWVDHGSVEVYYGVALSNWLGTRRFWESYPITQWSGASERKTGLGDLEQAFTGSTQQCS